MRYRSTGRVTVWCQLRAAWLVKAYNESWPWQVQLYSAPLLGVFHTKNEAIRFMEDDEMGNMKYKPRGMSLRERYEIYVKAMQDLGREYLTYDDWLNR